MRRQALSNSHSQAYFQATVATHPLNMRNAPMRGGWRL